MPVAQSCIQLGIHGLDPGFLVGDAHFPHREHCQLNLFDNSAELGLLDKQESRHGGRVKLCEG